MGYKTVIYVDAQQKHRLDEFKVKHNLRTYNDCIKELLDFWRIVAI